MPTSQPSRRGLGETYGTMPYMRRTTLYLPDTLKARVERAARQYDVSEAELMRAAIDEYTREHVPVRPTLPLFESIGAPDLADKVDAILAASFGAD